MFIISRMFFSSASENQVSIDGFAPVKLKQSSNLCRSQGINLAEITWTSRDQTRPLVLTWAIADPELEVCLKADVTYEANLKGNHSSQCILYEVVFPPGWREKVRFYGLHHKRWHSCYLFTLRGGVNRDVLGWFCDAIGFMLMKQKSPWYPAI